MRKIVITSFVTLDGVIESPEKWSFDFQSDDTDQHNLDVLLPADDLLLGRVTYEGFAAAWPNMHDESGYADKFNAMRKVVVATTPVDAHWNNTKVVRDDVVAQLRALKQEPGGDILVWGSATLAQTLIQHDLVDAYELLLCPTIVGGGKRLFADDGQRHKLKVAAARTLTGGMVALRLEPATVATQAAGAGAG